MAIPIERTVKAVESVWISFPSKKCLLEFALEYKKENEKNCFLDNAISAKDVNPVRNDRPRRISAEFIPIERNI